MRTPAALISALACAVLAGCAAPADLGFGWAEARLQPTKGYSGRGLVRFEQAGGAVRIQGEVLGLQAGRMHGFHIHDKGDCSAPDATSAGGHFNPSGKPHGKAGELPHHAGDLPALRADRHGVARFEIEVTGIRVGSGGPDDIIGRALIVHRDPDDFESQPAGNSGPRIGCAVIVRS